MPELQRAPSLDCSFDARFPLPKVVEAGIALWFGESSLPTEAGPPANGGSTLVAQACLRRTQRCGHSNPGDPGSCGSRSMRPSYQIIGMNANRSCQFDRRNLSNDAKTGTRNLNGFVASSIGRGEPARDFVRFCEHGEGHMFGGANGVCDGSGKHHENTRLMRSRGGGTRHASVGIESLA
jgi:hypothetical protein